jgi:hypothetical protein
MSQTGQKQVQYFFKNLGGLNLTDSTFTIDAGQATGGFNYEYVRTGGIQTSLAPFQLNTTADAQLKTLGLFLRSDKFSNKSIIRAAGTAIQQTDLMGSFVDLADDTTAANMSFLTDQNQPVVGSMTTSTGVDVLWLTGGGMAKPYGVLQYTPPSNATLSFQNLTFTAVATDITGNAITVALQAGGTAGAETATVIGTAITVFIQNAVSTTAGVVSAIYASTAASALITAQFADIVPVVAQTPLHLTGGGRPVSPITQVTQNGVDAPQGALTATEEPAAVGTWDTIGDYWYTVAFHKKSTGQLSNVTLDTKATVTAVTNLIALDLTGITNNDTTKYDKIYVYRSSVGGGAAYTTGELVAILDSTVTTFEDAGAFLTVTDNVGRPGNTLLDNSPLPKGTYKTLTLWKRRLVTATGSTLYITDLNKFESWPLANTIDVPSGGAITGLAIISFTTPSATTTDEFLAVFKETECWILTGNSLTDWSLKFIDSTGCLGQPLIVTANGYLFFIDNRGVYLWDGAGKPVYISRPIEQLFGSNGTIDRSKLYQGFGSFFRPQNEVVWALTNTDLGTEQTYLLKLDIRLTLPNVSNTLGQRILDGVFLQGKTTNPVYAGASFVFPTSSNQEDVFISGDDAGHVYRQFYSHEGNGSADVDFYYETKHLECALPGIDKNFEKVIAWVENVGDWNLTLDYWTNYRTSDDENNSVSVTINPTTDGTTALWDVAKWDQAKWDGYSSRPKAITFNLRGAPYNTAQGEVIKWRFKNNGSNEPITIYGFSVLYTEVSLRK